MVRANLSDGEPTKSVAYPPWKVGMKKIVRVPMRDEDGNRVEGKYVGEKRNVLADQKSIYNHKHMSNQVKNNWGVLWQQADRCDLFRQNIKRQKNDKGILVAYKKDKNQKDITTRANRVLSGHTLKTLGSGAMAAANAQAYADSQTLRLSVTKEDTKYPMMPTLSVGASYAIEAAFTAYVQEIFATAVAIKDNQKKHTKVTAKCCQAAAEIINRKLSAATGFVPISVPFRKTITKRSVKTGVGGQKKSTKAA